MNGTTWEDVYSVETVENRLNQYTAMSSGVRMMNNVGLSSTPICTTHLAWAGNPEENTPYSRLLVWEVGVHLVGNLLPRNPPDVKEAFVCNDAANDPDKNKQFADLEHPSVNHGRDSLECAIL